MKRFLVAAAVVLFGAGGALANHNGQPGPVFPDPSTFKSRGECISTHNRIANEHYGPPGQNTYTGGGSEPLSASERAQQQKADRDRYCSAVKAS